MSDIIDVEGAGDTDTRLESTAVSASQPRPLVHVKRGGVESYDVHYLIGNRNKKKLPPAILSERVVHEGRPRRSSLSADAGA